MLWVGPSLLGGVAPESVQVSPVLAIFTYCTFLIKQVTFYSSVGIYLKI